MKNIDEVKEKLDDVLISISLYDKELEYQNALLENMESLMFIQLIVEIESAFNIGIPDEMLLLENFKEKESIIKIIINQLLESEKNT